MAKQIDWETENKKKTAKKKGILPVYEGEEPKERNNHGPKDRGKKLYPPLNNIELNYLIYAFNCMKNANTASLPTDHEFRLRISEAGGVENWVRAYAWQYLDIKTGQRVTKKSENLKKLCKDAEDVKEDFRKVIITGYKKDPKTIQLERLPKWLQTEIKNTGGLIKWCSQKSEKMKKNKKSKQKTK